MKNYSQPIKDALAAGWPITDLITLDLSTGPVRLSTAGHDITWGAITYQSSSLVLAVDGIKQQQELRVAEVSIQFTAVDQSLVALFLNNNQQNRKVTIERVVLNLTHNVVGSLIKVNHNINSHSIDDSDSDSVLNVSISNSMANFESVKGIRTTQESFRRFYPNTTSFINSKDTKKELKWGGK